MAKRIPHAFVLDALTPLSPTTRPMFGCLAVYSGHRILFILRRELPSMRSIAILGKKVTGWQVLPIDSPDFEEAALRACELVLRRDPRIGKVPKGKRKKAVSRG